MFKAIKRKLICEEYDIQLLQTDPKARRLLVQENRLIVKDGILIRKYYGECGQVTLIPKTNPRTSNYRTSKSNSWTNGETPGNHEHDPKMQKHFPGLAKRIKQWVLKCEDCI